MKIKHNQKVQLLLNIIFILLCAAFVIPFLVVVGTSFSAEADIVEYGYKIIPVKFCLNAYEFSFKNPDKILDAYKVTIIFSIVSMALSTFLMALVAYPLSKKDFKYKRGISFYLYFTMLFSGGLVPTYILITQYLHLDDTIWVYIIPGLISPWYVFMMRTFFQGIPEAISESAIIDGADEFRIFFTITLRLSKPVLATVALFTFLSKWNDWYTAMLYINDDELVSLQYLLQRIMMNIQLMQENLSVNYMLSAEDIPSESSRMAMAVIAAGPALIVFPFFQKYFTKGITVGSVKG